MVLMESGYIPYDVSNGVMKFSISDVSNNNISGTTDVFKYSSGYRSGYRC